jgi:phage tail tape-measure protein
MTKDIMQFAGRGIPIYEELAKIFKVSTQEVSKLVEAGKVGFPEVQKVIQNLTNSGGMFENLMQKQSKSLTGMISNLGDAWAQVINIIGSGALGDMIKKAVGLVTGLFGKIVEGSKTSIEKFKEAVSEKAMLMPDYRV